MNDLNIFPSEKSKVSSLDLVLNNPFMNIESRVDSFFTGISR